jgi:DNA-binding protein WhiA
MLFSRSIKDELVRRIPEKPCCMKAELAAFIQSNGSIHITTGSQRVISLQIQSENSWIVRKAFLTIKEDFGIHPEISCYKRTRLRKGNLYVLKVIGEAVVKDVLSSLCLIEGELPFFNKGTPRMLLESDCCRKSYIRALFVSSGSITTPEKTYHLEITVDWAEYADALVELLRTYHVEFKVSQRKGKWVLYLKDAEEIIQFLSILEAHSAILEMENVRVIKDVRNQINRLVNCETANLSKSAYASTEQIADIRLIEERIGLFNLPQGLQETAMLRLEYPYMNMRELADMHSPPISKSGVNHRLRRLKEMAKELQRQE